MTLTLYNTLTRRKEPFEPLDRSNVRMYVCGPTVYDYAHIGNARPVIVFDVLFRLLRNIYGPDHVTYARNITDVDDKINARAADEYPDLPLNEAIRRVTERTERQFREDVAALGVLMPKDVNKPGEAPRFVEPRATEYIQRTDGKLDMVRLIEKLVERGHAYVAEDHVLFDVSSMPDYGRLSNRSLQEMEAGARVDVAPYKKGPMDFVLWKPSKQAGVAGSNISEPAWPSPCGIKRPGRPGWHIECSAMAGALLGETFDIHGGGIDLVFPHHENELAQTRGAFGVKVMATNWMHNGFLQVEGEKMSKSLGNFVTIRELLETEKFGGRRWPGEVLRLAMLMTHYHEPIDWTAGRLLQAWRELWTWAQTFRMHSRKRFDALHVSEVVLRPDQGVLDALSDDLNTSEVITRLRALQRTAEKGDEAAAGSLGESLAWLGVYRVPYHWSYDCGETIAYRGGDDEPKVDARELYAGSPSNIRPDLYSKYKAVLLDARAIVLNEFKKSSDREVRQISLESINRKINLLNPSMETDGIRLIATEHCIVRFEPVGESARRDDARINALIEARNAARKAKDFKEADRIRDELSAMGIQLKDSKDLATGEIVTTWEVKR